MGMGGNGNSPHGNGIGISQKLGNGGGREWELNRWEWEEWECWKPFPHGTSLHCSSSVTDSKLYCFLVAIRVSAAVMTLSLGRVDTNWYCNWFYSISNYQTLVLEAHVEDSAYGLRQGASSPTLNFEISLSIPETLKCNRPIGIM